MSLVDWLVPGPLHAVVGVGVAAWLLQQRRRARPGRWRGWVLLWLAWTWIGATPALGNLLVQALENRHPVLDLDRLVRDESAQIVVLASGQMFRPGGRIDPVLDADGWERLRAGIALWRRTGGVLVLAGGPGSGPTDSFAGLMRRVALDAGVPETAIRTAGGSRNTYEDLRAAAAALPTPSAGVPAGPRYLVTSAMHMPRAMATAQRLGWQVRAVPCGPRQIERPSWRAWLPDNGDPLLWRDGLHEWIGLLVYRWRGWAA